MGMNEQEESITLIVGWHGETLPESDLADDVKGQEADAEFFELHPHRRIYQREPIGREMLFTTPGGHVLESIIVARLPGGHRIRKPIFRKIERREEN